MSLLSPLSGVAGQDDRHDEPSPLTGTVALRLPIDNRIRIFVKGPDIRTWRCGGTPVTLG